MVRLLTAYKEGRKSRNRHPFGTLSVFSLMESKGYHIDSLYSCVFREGRYNWRRIRIVSKEETER